MPAFKNLRWVKDKDGIYYYARITTLFPMYDRRDILIEYIIIFDENSGKYRARCEYGTYGGTNTPFTTTCFDTIKEAKAFCNDHHQKWMESMLIALLKYDKNYITVDTVDKE